MALSQHRLAGAFVKIYLKFEGWFELRNSGVLKAFRLQLPHGSIPMRKFVVLILAICGGVLLGFQFGPRSIAKETASVHGVEYAEIGSWENYAAGPGGWIETDPATGKPRWPGGSVAR